MSEQRAFGTTSTIFEKCFAIVVGEEGGFSDEHADAGNWTGGAVGVGKNRGTNWGISAAAYPTLDIQALTQADAQAIYQRDYWTPCCADSLPATLALLVFDAAVNNGVTRAKEWLQAALGIATDGVIGPQTMAALASQTGTDADTAALCAEFLARRIDFQAGLATWKIFGLGWSRRLAQLPWKTLTLKEPQ